MDNNCTPKNCSYFIGSDRFQVYRHKFAWTISLATLFTAIAFGFISNSFSNSHSIIIESNEKAINDIKSLLEPAKMSKDSCYYADDHLVASIEDFMQTTQSMLELESTKIQSDFTVLSLWAEILMVVFLVFSIYSMFKTDEMLRQSREGLKAIQQYEENAKNTITTIDDKVRKELDNVHKNAVDESKKVAEEAKKALSKLSADIDIIQADFAKDVEKKSDAFSDAYDAILKKITETSQQNQTIVEALLTALQNNMPIEESNSKKPTAKKDS